MDELPDATAGVRIRVLCQSWVTPQAAQRLVDAIESMADVVGATVVGPIDREDD
jgi:hypothetical protein